MKKVILALAVLCSTPALAESGVANASWTDTDKGTATTMAVNQAKLGVRMGADVTSVKVDCTEMKPDPNYKPPVPAARQQTQYSCVALIAWVKK